MNNTTARLRSIKWITLVCVFALLAGCVTFPQPDLRKRVVDMETDQPIPGTYVFVDWVGAAGTIGHSNRVCWRHEVFQTDANGEYPWPYDKERGYPTGVYLFKPGYGFSRNRARFFKPGDPPFKHFYYNRRDIYWKSELDPKTGYRNSVFPDGYDTQVQGPFKSEAEAEAHAGVKDTFFLQKWRFSPEEYKQSVKGKLSALCERGPITTEGGELWLNAVAKELLPLETDPLEKERLAGGIEIRINMERERRERGNTK
jgi:hypothetical protein